METKVYAARHNDKAILNASSSGGMFTAISDYFLDHNNAVVSSVYNYDTNQMEFQLFTSKEMRDKAIGSKYVQSIPNNIFNDAEDWLIHNRGMLLFVGMGCQADGFRKFVEVKGLRDRTVIVDIICHGVPSPKLWKDYIGHKVEYVTFKDKRKGWRNPSAYVIENGRVKSVSDYVRIFYNKCALRPSCYECAYSKIDRQSDMTIGDYWGIEEKLPEFYSPQGNALVLIHTKQGQDLWNSIIENLEWVESNIVDCLQPNLIKPTERSTQREQFWRDYETGGISLIIKKYGQEKLLNKIIRRSRGILNKFTARG